MNAHSILQSGLKKYAAPVGSPSGAPKSAPSKPPAAPAASSSSFGSPRAWGAAPPLKPANQPTPSRTVSVGWGEPPTAAAPEMQPRLVPPSEMIYNGVKNFFNGGSNAPAGGSMRAQFQPANPAPAPAATAPEPMQPAGAPTPPVAQPGVQPAAPPPPTAPPPGPPAALNNQLADVNAAGNELAAFTREQYAPVTPGQPTYGGSPVQTYENMVAEPGKGLGPEQFVEDLKYRGHSDRQPTGGVIDMTKPLDVNELSTHFGPNSKLNPEQQTQLATDLATKLKNERPEYYQGFQDIQAGKTDTEAAKLYQGRLQQAEQEFIQQRVQSDPQTASTPQGFGQMVNSAISDFRGMHPALQAMVGIGLPVGLIGVMSGLFGNGGVGMGILGVLGLGAGVLGGAAGGLFGNDARAGVGNMMTNAYEFFSGNELPKDVNTAVGPEAEAATQLAVQNAMNAENKDGTLAGWGAGQKIIDQKRQQADTLLNMPKDLAITALMGRGAKTPEEAESLLRSIEQQRAQAAAPDFLLNKAREEAMRRLTAADTKGVAEGGAGGRIAAILAARRGEGVLNNNMPHWAKSRENVVVQGMAKDPKLLPYLVRDANGNLSLPQGNTMEELRDNMLTAAYGAYPTAPTTEKQNSAHKIAVRHWTMKAARCWAGYEPVPGKKPYSNDSCRPVGSKKKDSKKKAK